MKWIMGLYTMGSGRRRDIGRVRGLRYGRMAVSIRAIGRMTRPMGREG